MASELMLENLIDGFPHVPAAGGALMAQAAMVCLDTRGHQSGVALSVEGIFDTNLMISWSEKVTEAKRRFWNDMDEATEHGATGVAILLMRSLVKYTVVERSRKGTGFDWWLGSEDNLFQRTARLEVSGILHGSSRRINSRIKVRLERSRRTEDATLPLYVVVVEFGKPRAKVAGHE